MRAEWPATGRDTPRTIRAVLWVGLSLGLLASVVTGCGKRSPEPMPRIGPPVVLANSSPWADQGASGVLSLSLIAGDIGGGGNLDGVGELARFENPSDVVLDAQGNLYIADNLAIRKITPSGSVSTWAGQSQVAGHADGVGTQAQFVEPNGLAIDKEGTVFVSDSGSHVIRKITPQGVVSTWAGTVNQGGHMDGPVAKAQFDYPAGVVVAGNGTVFVADMNNHVIRKITRQGVVSTHAGSPGEAGSDDGLGAEARFSAPIALGLDGAGVLYVADSDNETVRKVTPDGRVTTLAGKVGESGHEDGQGADARFHGLQGLHVDAQGRIWVLEGENHTIRQITPEGQVSTWAGQPRREGHVDGARQQARFDHPAGLVVAPDAQVYVVDAGNRAIRKISPQGEISTFAGSPPHPGKTNGVGQGARFNNPHSVAVDSAGSLYVADFGNHTIRKVSPSGKVTTWVGRAESSGTTDGNGASALFDNPQGLMVDAQGQVLVADSANNTLRLVSPQGQVSTLAGRAGQSGDEDGGRKKRARFNTPVGVQTDGQGQLYVADLDNHMLRKIDAHGMVSTLAGSAQEEAGHQDGLGAAARFNSPTDIAMDAAGAVLVADRDNHVIRKVTPDGQVTTWVGEAGVPGQVDGQGAAARLNSPVGLTRDDVGNLYIADLGNHAIRKLSPDGHLSTVLGLSTEQGIRLGNQPRLDSPVSLVWLGAGRLAILSNHALLLATLPAP